MLKTRLFTALLIGPLVLWAFYALADNYFALFILLLTVVGASEWARFAAWSSPARRILFTVIATATFSMLVYLHDAAINEIIIYLSLLWWFTCLILLRQFPFAKKHIMQNRMMKSIIGILLLAATLVSMTGLRENPAYGVPYVFYVLILIWVADSGAYFAGRALGKNKLMPNVSPGKTWEGVVGGLLSSFIVSLFALEILGITSSQSVLFILLSLLTVIFSVVGDLSESMFKRMVGIKDSGRLLPGHGGILDRIDSLMAAFPVFLSGLWLMEALG